ncbi:Aste57867_1483 [Aphanomyces stellatus]|uniref:Aste57867_1483 protein n=1 Tax=Aphanomyces stellatus TaxID=120398 RepID=A0A485K8Q9_9STRA|nr:hypothetical protein As57867_001482 [Aphanomyces stellatus]VFT78699.1 Aste57867_1483 [Aphanomyces stellatus]
MPICFVVHRPPLVHTSHVEQSLKTFAPRDATLAAIAVSQGAYAAGQLWPAFKTLEGLKGCHTEPKSTVCIGRSYVLAQIYASLDMPETSCRYIHHVLSVNPWHAGGLALSHEGGCLVHPSLLESPHRAMIAHLLDSASPRQASTWHFLEDHLYMESIEPGCIPVLLNLGALLHIRRQFGWALKYYTKILEMEPSHALALSNYDALLIDMSTPRSESSPAVFLYDSIALAPSFFHHAVPQAPTPDDLDAMRVDIAAANHRGDRLRALAKLRLMLVFVPDDPFLHNDLGAIYFQLGRMDDAARSFTRALEIYPYYVQALNNFASTWQVRGESIVALHFFRRAIAVDPTDSNLLYNVGNTLVLLGRADDAIDAYWTLLHMEDYLDWTHDDLPAILPSLSVLVATMLTKPIADLACVQAVLATTHGVVFRSPSSLRDLVDKTSQFDRAWNVFGLALHAKNQMHHVDRMYQTIQSACLPALSSLSSERATTHMIVQYFRPASPARQAEIDACLRFNLAHNDITHVHVLLEESIDMTAFHAFSRDLLPGQSKLIVAVVHRRLTFQAAFEYAREKAPTQLWVVCNADIYFDASLRSWPIPPSHVVALTRWQFDATTQDVVFQPRIDSQDAWLFYPQNLPSDMLPLVDIYLGYLRADSRLAYVLSSFNVTVVNWGLHIKAIHLHEDAHRTYTAQDTAWGADAYLPFSLD